MLLERAAAEALTAARLKCNPLVWLLDQGLLRKDLALHTVQVDAPPISAPLNNCQIFYNPRNAYTEQEQLRIGPGRDHVWHTFLADPVQYAVYPH